MKKVYLFCDAGMSTSMLAKKMQDCANGYNLPLEIEAHAYGTIEEVVKKENPDCILLGPQVKHLYEKTINKFPNIEVPIAVIDVADYGTMDAKQVLYKSLKLIKANIEKES